MNTLTSALFTLALAVPAAAHPQTPAPAPSARAAQDAPAAQSAPAGEKSAFSQDQLEQIVAPIALYPDSLLAQILMSSTYPLEVVEAGRWRAKNPKLQGDALEKALQEFTWDPSVKALCGFADVLKRMSDNLDWTQDLGDAFLGQKKAVMDAVQTMRRKALDAGTLKTSKELTVKEEADKIIVIQPADPEVIYVPTYYPSACYGSWGYPYWYYPPMYPPPPAGGAWFGFTAGIIWGAAIWGDCNWGGSDVDIDINNQNNFIDRTENGDRRQQAKDKASNNKGKFQHDPSHRKGVGYKDSKVAQKYGASPGNSRVTRDQARGYGDRASTRPAGGQAGTGATRPGGQGGAGGGAGTRPGGGSIPSQQPGAGNAPVSRPGGGTVPAQRPAAGGGASSAGNRPTARPTGQTSGSFTGSRPSGASARPSSSARASSSRGAASRGSAGARGGGGRGGGGRR